jgi:hypothetical protein
MKAKPKGLADRNRICIYLFISISLCITYAYNCYIFSTWGPVDEYSVHAFKSFSGSFQEYKDNMAEAWRSRIAANFLAGRLMPANADRHVFAESVSLWNALWLMACFLVFIAWDSRRAIFMIFGTFACLYYGFTVMADRHIYPWDMPSLFLFALMWLSVEREKPLALFCVCVIGMAFKETTALGALIYLFWRGMQWNRRLLWTFGTVVVSTGLKLVVDVLTDNPHVGFTMVLDAHGPLVLSGVTEKGIWYNLRALTMIYTNHPIFVNGGTFLTFLLLPATDWKERGWKVAGVAFLVGNFLFAIINEYRVFQEFIPVALWAIFKKAGAWDSGVPVDSQQPPENG